MLSDWGLTMSPWASRFPVTSQGPDNAGHAGFKLVSPRAPACSEFVHLPLMPSPTEEARNTPYEGSVGRKSALPPNVWKLQQRALERTGPRGPQKLEPKRELS